MIKNDQAFQSIVSKEQYVYLRKPFESMQLRYLILLLSVVFLATKSSDAQDPNFSQVLASHMYLNPALTGLSYTPTVVVNYRDRWGSFQGGYKTFQFSVDQHIEAINSGIGLSIVGDRAMNGLVNNYGINGFYSYFLPFTDEWGATFGLQFTAAQRSIKVSELIFLDQIDPSTGVQTGNLPSEEILSGDTNRTYFDMSGGLMLFSGQTYMGVSAKHFISPNISIAGIEEESKLTMQLSVHAGHSLYFASTSKFDPYITPNVAYFNQGKAHQILAGSQMGYGAFITGLWARHTISNFDALIVLLGLEKGIFRLGYSYDWSFGQSSAFNANTHEISLKIEPLEDPSKSKRRNSRKGLNCPDVLR